MHVVYIWRLSNQGIAHNTIFQYTNSERSQAFMLDIKVPTMHSTRCNPETGLHQMNPVSIGGNNHLH